MPIVKIKRIEKSIYNKSIICYFDTREREEFIIVSRKVLDYLHINLINTNDKIFVIETIRNNKRFWIAKKYIEE